MSGYIDVLSKGGLVQDVESPKTVGEMDEMTKRDILAARARRRAHPMLCEAAPCAPSSPKRRRKGEGQGPAVLQEGPVEVCFVDPLGALVRSVRGVPYSGDVSGTVRAALPDGLACVGPPRVATKVRVQQEVVACGRESCEAAISRASQAAWETPGLDDPAEMFASCLARAAAAGSDAVTGRKGSVRHDVGASGRATSSGERYTASFYLAPPRISDPDAIRRAVSKMVEERDVVEWTTSALPLELSVEGAKVAASESRRSRGMGGMVSYVVSARVRYGRG